MRAGRLCTLAVVCVSLLAAGVAQAQQRPGWPRSVAIGAAGVGGVYYVMGGAYARLIQERLGVPASVEVTGGPVQNLQLLEQRKIELAMVTTLAADEALRGAGWADHRYDAMRLAFPMFVAYAQWITRADSGIRSVADLNGKVVQLGPRGGTGELLGLRILDLFNIRPRRVVYGSTGEGADQLRDGLVDAAFGVIGIPVPAWQELAVTRPVRIFGFTRDQIDVLASRFAYVARTTIRPGVYRGQDDAVSTISMWNAIVVHKDLSADFVYELVKTILTNSEFLAGIHPAGWEHLAANVYYINLPLHPGAVRYYTEQRIKLRESQLPPH